VKYTRSKGKAGSRASGRLLQNSRSWHKTFVHMLSYLRCCGHVNVVRERGERVGGQEEGGMREVDHTDILMGLKGEVNIDAHLRARMLLRRESRAAPIQPSFLRLLFVLSILWLTGSAIPYNNC
jgi:hypothetical protein